MGWTTPHTYATSDVVTAANLNETRDNLTFLKSGVALVSSVTSSQGPTSGTTELVVATSPAFTADGSTLVAIDFTWYNINESVAGDFFQVKLYEGTTPGAGTQLAQWIHNGAPSSTVIGGGLVRAVVTPSAGTHTYTARIVRSSGSGTATLSASSTAPAILMVTQVN